MPPKAVALTKDELYERCSSTIISARDVRAFVKDESFIQITTRNEQMIFFQRVLGRCLLHFSKYKTTCNSV